MNYSTKTARLLPLLLLLVAVFAVVGGVAAQDAGIKVLVTGRNMGPNDLPTQDPSLMEDVPSVQVAGEMFPGLTNLNEETAQVGPGTATYDISEDGKTFTLHIQDNIPWVHYNADSGQVEQVVDDSGNVRMLTAQDYYYGIMRTLDSKTAGPYQYVLTPWIVGGAEFSTSDPNLADADRQALIDAVGLKVIDEHTLQLTAPVASSVVPLIMSMWVTWAEPQWAIDANSDLWTDPENINTYGPFTMKDWVRGDGGSLTLIKNPFWPGTPNSPVAKIDEVQNVFLDKDPQLANFEAGTLDVSEVPTSAIDRVKTDANLSALYASTPGSCTYSYIINPTMGAPFDDPRARLAFSEDINRQAIVENITKAGEAPASFWELPSLAAAPTEAAYPEQGVYYNPDHAKQIWQEYLTETGHQASDFSPVLASNSTALHDAIAQAVQQQWQQDLGVTIQYKTMDFQTFLQNRAQYDIFRYGWCYDYPDAYNFLHDALVSVQNFTWHDDTYYNLVEQALATSDLQARTDLDMQADQMLVKTLAVDAPIYFYVNNDLTQPGITRTHSVINREAYEKWDMAS